jgi:small-conductance mechanosensitive channel
MKTFRRALLVVSLALMAIALVGVVFSRYWVNAPQQQAAKTALNQESRLVDEQPLISAQQLETLAATPEEQQFAQEIVRVADHEVDLAFAAAFRDATLHAAPLTAEARAIQTRIKDLQSQVKAEQDDIASIKVRLPKASENEKQSLEEELQLQQALLEVAQEEMDDAKQDLIRAGGDPQSIIQRLQEQHEQWHQSQSTAAARAAADGGRNAAEATNARSVVAQFGAWRQLRAKQKELQRAREEVQTRRAALSRQHDEVEHAPQSGITEQPENNQTSAARTDNASGQSTASSGILSTLKQVAAQQKSLADLDKRVQDFAQLDNLYGNWGAFVVERQRTFAVGLVEAFLWIIAILILVIFANPLAREIFSWLNPESKRLNTLRVATRFAIQVVGVALILLVFFGPPNQLATVVALAGAGLTVALKDFIVGFFGWFVLMGPNGIRPGDWVEINGVGGEVLEVTPLHTVLLETGSWSDAGHPTGRKITFVNSFAIEGHYFNFSTSGQWLWDEIQVPIPADVDPHPILDAIQTIVASETEANTKLAEQEWQHVVHSAGKRSFSAGPAISVQPTSSGINVLVRYITRVQQWREVRSQLYREIVDLLRAKQISHGAADIDASDALRTPAITK